MPVVPPYGGPKYFDLLAWTCTLSAIHLLPMAQLQPLASQGTILGEMSSDMGKLVMEFTMFKRIDHVEIVPHDFERAIGFYTEVLGFTVKERRKVEASPLEEVAFLVLGDTVLELLRVTNASLLSLDSWHVGYRMMALEVDDMDKALEYLAGKGVAITWGPVNLGKSKRAEINDFEGFPIELRQW